MTILYQHSPGQNNYPSVILPTEFGNVNASNIYFKDSFYVIAGIFENKSCLFIVKRNLLLHNLIIYDSTVFSRNPLNFQKDDIYAFSKNRQFNPGLQILKINNLFELNNVFEFSTGQEFDFPITSLSEHESFYCAYISVNNNNQRLSTLSKYTEDFQLEWEQDISVPEADITTIWNLQKSYSADILYSYTFYRRNTVDLFARINKVSRTGNVIWSSDTLKKSYDLNQIVHFTELSDSTYG